MKINLTVSGNKKINLTFQESSLKMLWKDMIPPYEEVIQETENLREVHGEG
jgi:hypothetical protein